MKSTIRVVSTPSADTPGTLLHLETNGRRYLIGNIPEGSQRKCIDTGTSLGKVSNIFITGKTTWANVGGLLGLTLSLADTKKASHQARAEALGNAPIGKKKEKLAAPLQLSYFGAPNLKHVLATARRFIFRTGIPMDAIELDEDTALDATGHVEPVYIDESVKVWAMGLTPSNYTKMETTPQDKEDNLIRSRVLHQMFNSQWTFDRLVPRKLSKVPMPATIYARDPQTKQILKYTGPMPGDDGFEDIEVLTREPWPAVNYSTLPRTRRAAQSMCYIFKLPEQKGKFLPDKAKALGITPGPLFSKLKNGQSVVSPSGETVTPGMVLEPDVPGSACAVLDIPSPDYIPSLLSRRELADDGISGNLNTFVWLLGPGVGSDSRIRQFQDRYPEAVHVVSSTDYNDNIASLQGATLDAMRHHLVDAEIFPAPRVSSVKKLEDSGAVKRLKQELPQSRISIVGQQLNLQVQSTVSHAEARDILDISKVESDISSQVSQHEDLVQGLQVTVDDKEQRAWEERMPHGDVEIISLGTGSSQPGKYRNVSGTLVRVPGWGTVLLDCGEGTLNTMRRLFSESELAEILADLRIIWISHLHADHHLGLMSILQAHIGLQSSRPNKMSIVSRHHLHQWLHEYHTVEDLDLSAFNLIGAYGPTAVEDFKDGQVTLISRYSPLENAKIEHVDVPAVTGLVSLNTVSVSHCYGAEAVTMTFPSGFRLSYSGDCRPSKPFAVIGRGSHLLIHEATFEDDMRHEAVAKKHSTAGEAITVASDMEAALCLLTHFSQRYPKIPPLGVNVQGKRAMLDGPSLDAMDEGEDNVEEAPGPLQEEEPSAPKNSQPVITHDQIIDMIRDRDIKVVFAFDYMRLRLKNVPRLISKQPVVNSMYEHDIAKGYFDSPAAQALAALQASALAGGPAGGPLAGGPPADGASASSPGKKRKHAGEEGQADDASGGKADPAAAPAPATTA